MKRELLNDYFQRDLSVDEESRVAELLKDSPEEALRFAGLAESEYKASGYPEPAPRIRRGGPWLLRGLGLCAAAGAGIWLWCLLQSPAETEARRVSESSSLDTAAPPPAPTIPHAAMGVDAAPAAEAAPDLGVQVLDSGRFKLTVDLGAAHRVELSLCDVAGRPLRAFYSGSLDGGRWSFVWDGRLADGSAAQPGVPYQVTLKARGVVLRRWLQLERKQIDGINGETARP
jgi:hypothetical protein